VWNVDAKFLIRELCCEKFGTLRLDPYKLTKILLFSWKVAYMLSFQTIIRRKEPNKEEKRSGLVDSQSLSSLTFPLSVSLLLIPFPLPPKQKPEFH
jgi:hypothetical protein